MRDKRAPLVRKGFLIGLAASLAALVAACFLIPVSLTLFDAWISAPQGCPSTCKGYLGRNRAPGEGHPTYTPTCQPAEFSLELHSARVKAEERYPLWHKTVLRNTSCFSLVGLSAYDLIKGPMTIIVLNSRGEVVPRAARQWNTVNSYSYDREAFEAMRRNPEFEWSVGELPSGMELYYIRLNPGSSVSNLPSMILPSLNWLQPHGGQVDLTINNESMQRLIEPSLRGKTIVQPPTGYAVVDGYVFHKPGRYSIQVEFWGSFRQVSLHPRYEWYHKHVPGVVQAALDWMHFLLWHFHMGPGPDDLETMYDLRIRSNTVEFEVIP